jgi:hypothetical protein
MRFPLELVADCIVNPRSYLQGGRIYGITYLIAIIEGKYIVAVYEGLLRNNFRSQRPPCHSEGYQPFLIKDHEWDFDIKTETIETRRIILGTFAGKSYVHRQIKRENAVILRRRSRDSEQYRLLQTIASRTWLKEKLRRVVSANSSDATKLEIAAQLLQEAVLGGQPRVTLPAITPADKRFELYVELASDHVLDDLYSLLIMESPAQNDSITKSA